MVDPGVCPQRGYRPRPRVDRAVGPLSMSQGKSRFLPRFPRLSRVLIPYSKSPMETAAESRTNAKERRRQGRRQQRLLLSCSECRKRKIGCDRSKPCNGCVRSNRVDRCQYDTSSAPEGTSSIPGQIVFSAVPKTQQTAQLQPQPRSVSARESVSALSWSGSEDDQSREQPSLAAAVVPPTPAPKLLQQDDVASPLHLFWHGSRGVDQYVSPFDRKTISVPKEVVFGENDATVYWGRSHETNFVPRVSESPTMTSMKRLIRLSFSRARLNVLPIDHRHDELLAQVRRCINSLSRRAPD